MSDPGAEAAWLARIREVVPLVAVPPAARSREALVDWLVRCAESPHTRLEGAAALFPAAGAGGRGRDAPVPSPHPFRRHSACESGHGPVHPAHGHGGFQ